VVAAPPGLFPPAADDPPLTTIHNLVGTCEIFSSVMPIDLEFVYKSLPNSFYDRKRFAAITIRVTQPVCTGLLFTSGKLVVTGCKTLVVSRPAPCHALPRPAPVTPRCVRPAAALTTPPPALLQECTLASLKVVRMLQRHIPTVTFLVRNAVVQNVVAHVVIPLLPGQRLNVDRLYEEEACFSTFQKNMFPGLIYRPDNSPVVLLCFYSGKVVITGGKKEAHISEGWNRLWPKIRQYVE